jgi:signal transduction histidine kinase
MKKQNSQKRFWLFYHIGLLLFSAVTAILMKYKQYGNALEPTVVVPFVTIFMMSTSIGYLAIFIIKKAKIYTTSQLTKKIIPVLILFYLVAYMIANVSITLGVLGWFIYTGRDMSEFWPHLFKNELSFGNNSFFLWLMFFTIAFFYILWQKSVKLEQALREENLKYKYRNLKSQVNPHFLFNSLNTLSELVYDDAKKADNYIQKLSSIYRYVLENEETDLISLKEELKFIQQYFNLQKVRDNDKIFLEIDVQREEEFKIIPVSLQLLVENALKHNSMSRDKPMIVKIANNDDYVIVTNTIQRKNILENSTQMGLLNLKERVSLIMGRELIVNEDTDQFVVKLPIIRLPK